jgi:ribosomal protein S18 acetylase RimI-like enzyme
VKVFAARFPRDRVIARSLLEAYRSSVGVDLCFEGFDDELRSLPGKYASPRGIFLLGSLGTQAAGCVGLRPIGSRTAEMKRLYVQPAARGRGLGDALVRRFLREARRRGYRRVRLDTLQQMTQAYRLYRRFGFRRIHPYRFNPYPGTRYLELVLKPRRATAAVAAESPAPTRRGRPASRGRRARDSSGRPSRRTRRRAPRPTRSP